MKHVFVAGLVTGDFIKFVLRINEMFLKILSRHRQEFLIFNDYITIAGCFRRQRG